MTRRILRRITCLALCITLLLGPGGGLAMAAAVRIISPPERSVARGLVEIAIGFDTQSDAPVTKADIHIDGKPYAVKAVTPPSSRGVVSMLWDTTLFADGFRGVSVYLYNGQTLVGKSYVKIEVANRQGAGSVGGAPPKLDAGRVQILNLQDGEAVKGVKTVSIVPDQALGTGVFVSASVDKQLQFLSNRAPFGFTLDTRDMTEGTHLLEVEVKNANQDVLASRAIRFNVMNAGSLTEEIRELAKAPTARPDSASAPKPLANVPAPVVAPAPSQESAAPAVAARAESNPATVQPVIPRVAPASSNPTSQQNSVKPVTLPAQPKPQVAPGAPVAPEPVRIARVPEAIVPVTVQDEPVAEAPLVEAAPAASGNVSKLAPAHPAASTLGISPREPVLLASAPKQGLADRSYEAARPSEAVAPRIVEAPEVAIPARESAADTVEVRETVQAAPVHEEPAAVAMDVVEPEVVVEVETEKVADPASSGMRVAFARESQLNLSEGARMKPADVAHSTPMLPEIPAVKMEPVIREETEISARLQMKTEPSVRLQSPTAGAPPNPEALAGQLWYVETEARAAAGEIVQPELPVHSPDSPPAARLEEMEVMAKLELPEKPLSTGMPATVPVQDAYLQPGVRLAEMPEPSPVIWKQVNPRIESGIAMVNLRESVAQMGGTVTWDHSRKIATASLNGKSVIIDYRQETLNGSKDDFRTSRIQLQDGRTVGWVRAIAEKLGAHPVWDSAKRTVMVAVNSLTPRD